MSDVLLGIDDENYGLLEGVVGQYISKQDGDKQALNFVIECTKNTRTGKRMARHHVVVFDTRIIEKFAQYIVTGAFIRVKYHLIEQSKEIDGQAFVYSKPCVDFLSIEE